MSSDNGNRTHWNPKVLSIVRPPSPREVYWIGAIEGSSAPEFTGYHPGVIIRGVKSLHERKETVTFVPLTSTEPRKDGNGRYPPHVHELSANPNPCDDRRVWAVCSNIMTVRLTRLERYRTPEGMRVPKVTREDFHAIIDRILFNYGTIRNHVESLVQQRELAIREEYDARLRAVRTAMAKEYERKVSERALEPEEDAEEFQAMRM